MMKLKPGVRIHQQEKMADGRRHSVDIPLSKTLMTLKRVRSLRDPSTISMNKFLTSYDNMKWEANEPSSSPEVRDVAGNDDQQKSRFSTSEAGRKEEGHDSNLESGNESKMDDPQFTPNNNKPSRLQNGNGWQNLLEEEADSYSEPVAGHMKRHNARVQMKKGGHGTMKNLAAAVDDFATSRVGSPCLSLSETQTNRSRNSLLAFTNDEANPMDSNYSGCGLSSCWSRTPKFRDPDNYFEMDDPEHPLLTMKRKDTTFREVNICLDSPRSLSQKYRPKTFDELVGQHVVAQSLTNAISKSKISPIYLFHGPRGTGKTSMARVFAAALNCLSLEAYRPCGFCRECVFIFSGRCRDVKELDGSKINRKDRMKALLKSAIAPYSSSFKVYIVDECQFLQPEAWPAILNSIEASRRTIFIMVTSELEKLPSNSASRCQRYHFPKIKDTDIASRLQKMCVEEALDFDKDALDFVATKSNGSLRDAEIMLDQLSLLGKKITIPLVHELVGVISDDELVELLDLALSSDASNTVRRARELMSSKVDPMQLTSQLANLIMDILAGRFQSECSEAVRSFLGRHSLAEVGLQKLRHALKILSETEKQLRASKNQATWLTVALLQFSSDDSSSLAEGEDPKAILKTMCLRGSPRESQNGSCDHKNPRCSEKQCDTYNKLNVIWRKAAEKCQTDSFRKFLLKEGKLSSIRVSQGLAIAEIQFFRPDGLSRAEKSWKQIAAPLRLVLGCNVEIRISLVPSICKQNFKMRKPSFRFLSCGQRQDKCDSSATEDNDMETCTSKEGFFQVYTDDYGQNLSPVVDLTNGGMQIHDKEPPNTRNNKGSTPSVDGVSSNGTMQPGVPRVCHDAVSDVSKDNVEEGQYFCMQEPEQHHQQPCCFPKVLRPRRKYISSDIDSAIRSNLPPHNKLEITSPSLASSDLHYCSSNSYVFCAKSDELTTYNAREGALLKKHGKDNTNFHCWDAAKSSIIKGCEYQQHAQSSRWVLPCFQGKPPRPPPAIAAGAEVRS